MAGLHVIALFKMFHYCNIYIYIYTPFAYVVYITLRSIPNGECHIYSLCICCIYIYIYIYIYMKTLRNIPSGECHR
jgi:hypothetical protein